MPEPTALLVNHYDAATAFSTWKLGFDLREDAGMVDGGRRSSRRVGRSAAFCWRGRSANGGAGIGDQRDGRIFLLLETDGSDRDHAVDLEVGAKFHQVTPTEAVRHRSCP